MLGYDTDGRGRAISSILVGPSQLHPNSLILLNPQLGPAHTVRLTLAGAAALRDALSELLELANWSGIAHAHDPDLEASL